MERSKAVNHVEDATDRKSKIAALIAVVIVSDDMFNGESATEICETFGMPSTYKHTMRSILKVREELHLLGYEVRRIKGAEVRKR